MPVKPMDLMMVGLAIDNQAGEKPTESSTKQGGALTSSN